MDAEDVAKGQEGRLDHVRMAPRWHPTDVEHGGHRMLTLVPAVSFANLPQLTLDLVVHALRLPLVARLEADEVVAFAGPREDGLPGVTTALEVYGGAGLRVLMQRAPVLRGREGRFLDGLFAWLGSGGEGDVLLLTSANRAFRSPDDPLFQQGVQGVDMHEEGVTTAFLQRAQHEGLPVRVLAMFAYQGDNSLDARRFADELADVAAVPRTEWTPPPSWARLYGEERDRYEGGTLF